jgi:hypothetical protein
MHPRISELLAYIEQQTAVLRDAYESVPPDQRLVRPAPDRWSPAEIIHHLGMSEQRLMQRLGDLIEQARELPPETETTSVLSDASTRRVLDRTKRFVTSEIMEPRNTDPDRVWDDLIETRRAMLEVIASGDGLALGGVSTAHPRLGAFTGYDWIAFVGSHAARHADQIREISASREVGRATS